MKVSELSGFFIIHRQQFFLSAFVSGLHYTLPGSVGQELL